MAEQRILNSGILFIVFAAVVVVAVAAGIVAAAVVAVAGCSRGAARQSLQYSGRIAS